MALKSLSFKGTGFLYQHQLPDGQRRGRLEDAGGHGVAPGGEAHLLRHPQPDHSQVSEGVCLLSFANQIVCFVSSTTFSQMFTFIFQTQNKTLDKNQSN